MAYVRRDLLPTLGQLHPSPARRRFGGLQLLTGLQDKLGIMLGGQIPTLSTGIFHDDNWKQTTQSDDSPSPNHADGGELGNIDSSRLNQPAEALQTQ